MVSLDIGDHFHLFAHDACQFQILNRGLCISVATIEQVDQEREFSVVMIDASNRPDWAAMQRAQP
ncbi:MAG: hypothetical protein WB630_00745, partial [Candidatus Acidiferrales bacterium]